MKEALSKATKTVNTGIHQKGMMILSHKWQCPMGQQKRKEDHGVDEEIDHTTPMGEGPRRKEKANGVGEFVCHEVDKTDMHTKVRCHKERPWAASHGLVTRNTRQSLHSLREVRRREQQQVRETMASEDLEFNALTRQQMRDLENTINLNIGDYSTEKPHMSAISVFPRRLKEFLLPPPPPYKSLH